jgi:hypothetical protein
MSAWEFTEDTLDESANDRLSDQIIIRCVESKFDHAARKFLPAGAIEELVTMEAILKEIFEKTQLEAKDMKLEGYGKKVVEFILGNAKKAFAITILSNLTGRDLQFACAIFMEGKITDESLPLEMNHFQDFERIARDKSKNRRASPWSTTRSNSFLFRQWEFLAPVFSKATFRLDLEPEHILPFLEKGTQVKGGAFSKVSQVSIHPAHQQDLIPMVRLTYVKYSPSMINLNTQLTEYAGQWNTSQISH